MSRAHETITVLIQGPHYTYILMGCISGVYARVYSTFPFYNPTIGHMVFRILKEPHVYAQQLQMFRLHATLNGWTKGNLTTYAT